MLEFQPEPVEELKARYPEALEDVFNPLRIQANPELSPGKKRKHTFDFENGLRLIVSVDEFKKERVTHYSASMYPDNPHTDIIKFTLFVAENINALREDELVGCLKTVLDEAGVLHCFYTEPKVPVGNPKWN